MTGPTPPTYLPPGDEMVARVWLRSLPALAGVSVGSTMPPVTSWPGGIWIQTTSLPGPADPYLPVRGAPVQVDVWCGPDEWERATAYADLIFYGCYRADVYGLYDPDATGYDRIRLVSVVPQGGPRRIGGDPQGLARASLDIAFTYLPAALAYTT